MGSHVTEALPGGSVLASISHVLPYGGDLFYIKTTFPYDVCLNSLIRNYLTSIHSEQYGTQLSEKYSAYTSLC